MALFLLILEVATETLISLVTSIPWGCTRHVSLTERPLTSFTNAPLPHGSKQSKSSMVSSYVLSFVMLDGAALLLLLCSIEYPEYLFFDDGGLNTTFHLFGMTFSMTGRIKGRQAAIKYMPLSTTDHPTSNTEAPF
jgi:hypothetical protein